ncbi:MAG: alpha-glucosidase C-terminal domain-containing protein [Planctomycetes bacterium]|nr:alpha-glucosidase C-terminal domain-containing protein [Planctomycetota bacterium]
MNTCSMTEEEKARIAEAEARKSPSWLEKSVIYQIFLRSFTTEGTIKAAEKKLPELAELGVDIIYLCPICLQDDDMRQEHWSARQKASGINNPKNPYRIKDYFTIDPEYGIDDDLHSFIKAAHGLGMKVILDIVFLHCGPTSVFLEEHPEFVKREKDGSFVKGAWPFPLLDFKIQALREYLWDNLEYWIKNFGVDGYRCDVADYIPLDFWEEGRKRIEKLNPEVIMLSEGSRESDQLNAFDMNYSFAWSNLVFRETMGEKKKTAAFIREAWEETCKIFPRGARFIRYTENHDIVNDNSRFDIEWGIDAHDAALAIIFTLDGIPLIYNGQEAADTARHSIFGYIPIEWEKAGSKEGRQRFTLLQQLCSLRHNEPALSKGSVEWLENSCPEKVVSFARTIDGEKIITVVNFSAVSIEAKITGGSGSQVQNLIAKGGVITSDNNNLSATLEPFAYIISKHNS